MSQVNRVHNFMTQLLVAAIFVSLLTVQCWGQPSCRAVVFASVAVTGNPSLADLLAPETCAQLLEAAARVGLGAAPAWGSVRVLDGSEVRALVENTAKAVNLDGSMIVHIPERIRIQRAGTRASCADIEARIFSTRTRAASGARAAHRIDCGAVSGISRDTPLEVIRRVWDPALQSWDVQVRCSRFSDCVPFLVRMQNLEDPAISPHREMIASPSGVPVPHRYGCFRR
jgi:hypothetical protein